MPDLNTGSSPIAEKEKTLNSFFFDSWQKFTQERATATDKDICLFKLTGKIREKVKELFGKKEDEYFGLYRKNKAKLLELLSPKK